VTARETAAPQLNANQTEEVTATANQRESTKNREMETTTENSRKRREAAVGWPNACIFSVGRIELMKRLSEARTT